MKILSSFFVRCVYIYNLSNKKMCVYNKKNMCIYVCIWGCLDKYISVATCPPKQKFLAPPLIATSKPKTNLTTNKRFDGIMQKRAKTKT